MRIRIQLLKICNKYPDEEFSLDVKNLKIAQMKETTDLVKFYFKNLNILAVFLTNFLASLLFLFEIFPSWIRIHSPARVICGNVFHSPSNGRHG